MVEFGVLAEVHGRKWSAFAGLYARKQDVPIPSALLSRNCGRVLDGTLLVGTHGYVQGGRCGFCGPHTENPAAHAPVETPVKRARQPYFHGTLQVAEKHPLAVFQD